MRCRLLTDMWEDSGIVYTVYAYNRIPKSTGIVLELECSDGTIITRTVADHQIEWIEDES